MRNGNGASEAVRVRTPQATPRAVTLEVPAIRLQVRLGCEAAERAVPQAVEIELRVRFADLPAACWTDELADTVCYAELASLLRAHCAGREFRLVERLALELSGLMRACLPDGARLTLTVVKLAPPVPELVRGVRFTIDDRCPTAIAQKSHGGRSWMPIASC